MLRVATWIGGPEAFAATSLGGPRLPSISKHALWLVLQLGPDPLFHVPATVIDVRRPDERLSYGAIRGTINIPGAGGGGGGQGSGRCWALHVLRALDLCPEGMGVGKGGEKLGQEMGAGWDGAG